MSSTHSLTNSVDHDEMRRLVEENRQLKARLTQLTQAAEHNEILLHRTQERELSLLRADSLTQLLHALVEDLRNSYALESVSVVLLDPQHELRHLLVAGGERLDGAQHVIFTDAIAPLAPHLSSMHSPWLGPYAAADHQLLFPSAGELQSVALLPLQRKERLTGVLCFGSKDAQRFTPQHATDFLAHLGALAAVCVENAANRTRLLRAGITDFLTGWHNRRYLQQRLKEEIARAQRRQCTVACLILDLDRFKSINDAYGHLAGDAALKEIAHRVESQIRGMDTAARFGGDEFAIILPDTEVSAAAKLAERIRESVASRTVALGHSTERVITLSIGVGALTPSRNADAKALTDRLIADADAALYRAKALGRNRVQVGA